MKNMLIKIISLLLSLSFVVFALNGCNTKNDSANNTSSNIDSSQNSDDLSEDEGNYDDLSEDEEYFDDFEDYLSEEDQQESEVYLSEMQIFNATPVNKSFGGLGAVYHAYPYRDDAFGRKYDDKTAAFEIKRAAQTGMNSARTFYDMSLAWDSTAKKWNWNSDNMNAVYKWAKELEKYDVDVFLTFQSSGNYLFTSYEWSDPSAEGVVRNMIHEGILVEGDQKATLEKFGQWWADTLNAFRARGINNISRIAIATEPGAWWGSEWGEEFSKEYYEYQEKCAKSQAEAINVVSKVLKANNLRKSVEIVGPNIAGGSNERTQDYLKAFVKYVDSDACDLFSAHRYFGNDLTADNYLWWSEFAQAMDEVIDINKFVWDEYNTKPTNIVEDRRTSYNGVQLALAQIAQLNHGINSSYLWTIFDQQFPNNYTTNADSFTDGLQQCGLAPSLLVSSIVFPAYYSFSLASNLVGREGATVYKGEENELDGIYTTMTKGTDGSLNIMVVSTNILEVDVKLNFEKELNDVTFYRHVYDATDVLCTAKGELIQPDLKLSHVTDHITDTIKPYSVVVYTTEKICE